MAREFRNSAEVNMMATIWKRSKVMYDGFKGFVNSIEIKNISEEDSNGIVSKNDYRYSPYLRKFDLESWSAYQERLDNLVVDAFFREEILKIVDKPFSKPITLPENMNDDIQEILKNNVDGKRSNVAQFGKEWFDSAVVYGVSFVVGDISGKGDNATPFLKLIDPLSIIGAWEMKLDDGTTVISRLQFRTFHSRFDEAEDKEVHEETVYEYIHPNKLKTFTRTSERGDYVEQGEITIKEGMDRLPIVKFTTGKMEGVINNVPLFYEKAEKNLNFVNKKSDQDNILTVSRFPMLYATGVADKDQIKKLLKSVGPRKFFILADAQSKVGYVENTGSAIKVGSDDLERDKQDLKNIEEEYLNRRGAVTATGEELKASREISHIASLTESFEYSLNRAVEVLYELAQKTQDKEEDRMVRVHSDFSNLSESAKADKLLAMRMNGDLSQATFLKLYKRRFILPEDLNVEEEVKRIQDERSLDGFGDDNLGGGDENNDNPPQSESGGEGETNRPRPQV